MDGGGPTTEAQLRRLHDGHPSELIGLTPAHAGPVPSRQDVLEAVANDVDVTADMPRARTEALLDALRSENARLRSQITACATASATASPERSQSVEAHTDKTVSISAPSRSSLSACCCVCHVASADA